MAAKTKTLAGLPHRPRHTQAPAPSQNWIGRQWRWGGRAGWSGSGRISSMMNACAWCRFPYSKMIKLFTAFYIACEVLHCTFHTALNIVKRDGLVGVFPATKNDLHTLKKLRNKTSSLPGMALRAAKLRQRLRSFLGWARQCFFTASIRCLGW